MENNTTPLQNTAFSLLHFWQQGDLISHAVIFILLVMSIISWVQIVYKGKQLFHAVNLPVSLERFWLATNIEWGTSELKKHKVAQNMLDAAVAVSQAQGRHSLSMQGEKSDALTRAIRHSMTQNIRNLEHGLTMLASIGAVAPFVGLFGTVWGIFHALMMIGAQGAASLTNVSGPVGEALIMTAAGLFVAIPAVIAYNAFSRAVRITSKELDGFAYDLQAYLRNDPKVFGFRVAA